MAPPTESTITNLNVVGALPPELFGRLLGIGPSSEAVSGGQSPDAYDGMVHSVSLHAGRTPSYRSRWIITDFVAHRLGIDPSPGPRNNGPDIIASNVVAFGDSILALGDDSLAYELAPDLNTLRRVDLAGQLRRVGANPKRDPVTGDLHLLAVDATGAQAHVVVSSGAHTRTSRNLDGAPARISDLAISRDCIVFGSDGFVGVARRGTDAHVSWIATGQDAPYLVCAHDIGDTIIVFSMTPALERWTLHAPSATMRREVLDSTPQKFARANSQCAYECAEFLWSTTDVSVDKHDLASTSKASHFFERGQPSDLVFVADPSRPHDVDGGWLVGFVHHLGADETEVVVLDAADIAGRRIATIAIPRHIPRGLHSAWIPFTHP
jgi:carotenoid cleavage dioxygenase-like enzyme